MIPLILKYGMERVNKAGVPALGYPGLWATHKEEILIMEEWLCQNN